MAVQTNHEASIDAIGLDLIDVTSADSFPASDPPGWATGRAHPPVAAEASDGADTRPLEPEALSADAPAD